MIHFIDKEYFWEKTAELVGGSHNMSAFSKEVALIYSFAGNTISESYRKRSMPKFDTGIAIAHHLKVSPFILAGLDKAVSAPAGSHEPMHGEIVQVMNMFVGLLEKMHGFRIEYEVIPNQDKSSAQLLKKVSLCNFGKYSSVRFTVSADSRMHEMYDGTGFGEKRVQESYILVNGNIFREEDTTGPGEVVSVYDYVEKLCQNSDGAESIKQISTWLTLYRKERYLLGPIGRLGPNTFYWLNYVFGYLTSLGEIG